MRANKCVGPVFPDPEMPKTGATVYDFDVRQTEELRLRRMKTLQHENALLARVAIEIRSEIVHLQKRLIRS
jgi:hypothetical protein